jgi:hypothetical protein
VVEAGIDMAKLDARQLENSEELTQQQLVKISGNGSRNYSNNKRRSMN